MEEELTKTDSYKLALAMSNEDGPVGVGVSFREIDEATIASPPPSTRAQPQPALPASETVTESSFPLTASAPSSAARTPSSTSPAPSTSAGESAPPTSAPSSRRVSPTSSPSKKASKKKVVLQEPKRDFVNPKEENAAALVRLEDMRKASAGADDYDEHTVPVDELAGRYPESLIDIEHPKASKGLSRSQAAEKLLRDGPNMLTPPPKTPLWLVFVKQFKDPFLLLLIIAGILSFVAYGLDTSQEVNLYAAIALFVVVLFTALLSFTQEAKSAKTMDLFSKLLPQKCNVVRDGVDMAVPATELVVGDIVKFTVGDKIPADIRILHTESAKIECSSLTGESKPIKYTAERVLPSVTPIDSHVIAFNATFCVEGGGTGVVIRTGDQTLIGNIARLSSQQVRQQTIIEKEVERFVKFVSILAIAMATVAFSIGLIRRKGEDALDLFIYGFLVVIVANVPQGLPATVASILTITARRMARQNVLVKRLDTVETLGSATLICSDKTGTLTQNEMSVTEVWVDMLTENGDFSSLMNPFMRTRRARRRGKSQGADGAPGADLASVLAAEALKPIDVTTFEYLHTVASVCNASYADREDGPGRDVVVNIPAGESSTDMGVALKGSESPRRQRAADLKGGETPQNQRRQRGTSGERRGAVKQYNGNASDIALYRFCDELRSVEGTRERNPVKFEIQFNSTNKWQLKICSPLLPPPPPHAQFGPNREMGSLQDSPTHDLLQVMVKGAPEIVLNMCTTYLHNGEERKINDEFLINFSDMYRRFGARGCRVLGCAQTFFTAPKNANFSEEEGNFPTKNLCFIGMFALMDPPRRGVKDAIGKCHTAGIKVFMVTGDHPLTAAAIAAQVGILTREQLDVFIQVQEEADDSAPPEATDEFQFLNDPRCPPITLGKMIAGFTEEDWMRIVKSPGAVFARTTPQQKMTIVKKCQELGEIVAVTGDGVNDAPALKAADIGVSMGISGSDVAREAADVILLDDSFSSIVLGIEQGRLIFDNLKKTIAYTLTHLTPEVVTVLLNLLFSIPIPLTSLQILSIDLATEVGPAISLAYEGPESDLMTRPPRNIKKDNLVSRELLLYSYVFMGLLHSLFCFLSFIWVYDSHGIPPSEIFFVADDYFLETDSLNYTNNAGRFYTPEEQKSILDEGASAWYITLVLGQALHLWMCKTRHISLFKHRLDNPVSGYGCILAVCLMVIVVYVPGVQTAMGSGSVGWRPWVVTAIYGVVNWTINEKRKSWAHTHPNGLVAKLINW